MSTLKIRLRTLLIAATFLISLGPLGRIVMAEDAVTADPEHYKVEFENDRVRVIRITYGPGERSVMHEHGPGVVVFLNDSHFRFTFPDGTAPEIEGTANVAQWADAEEHLPENLRNTPAEVIYVELKD